jgi:oxaloacetate decarboxylase alpha subunit
MSTASIVKAVEAGIDRVDTAIGSMSMTYGHSATNSVVSILENSPRKTGLDLAKLAHVFNGFCHIHPSLQSVHWADGVRNGALGVLT